ncbi:MAG TPA: porin [Planctomycetota bacterium]
MLCSAALLATAAVAAAQDADQQKTIERLEKRLEALEKEKKPEKGGNAAELADPVEEKWYDRVKVGGGVRTTFRSVEDAAAHDGYSKDFALESGRIYMTGKITDIVSAEFNTEFTADSDGVDEQPVRILDALAKFKFKDELQVWLGRFLPPSDRANLDGPYYLATWDFPLVQAYPAKFAGRDDGVAVWGEFDKGRYRYQVGLFEGRDNVDGDADHLEISGRFVVSLLDPEAGYYTSSTYYGEKEILTAAFVFFFQPDVEGTPLEEEDFLGFSLDVLFEKKFDGFVVTGEFAFYSYDRGEFAGEGTGVLLLGAVLLPYEVGWGKFQPHVRFQTFDSDADPINVAATGNTDVERWDFGVNYVIAGHNLRISAVYTIQDNDTEDVAVETRDVSHSFVLGTQFQF